MTLPRTDAWLRGAQTHDLYTKVMMLGIPGGKPVRLVPRPRR